MFGFLQKEEANPELVCEYVFEEQLFGIFRVLYDRAPREEARMSELRRLGLNLFVAVVVLMPITSSVYMSGTGAPEELYYYFLDWFY
jgi:hypothetical protein